MSTSKPTSIQDEISLAASAMHAGDSETALMHLKSAVSAQPENELALGMLASVYAELGMTERAAEFYEKVLSISPTNPLARFQYGLLAFNAGELQRALDIWQAQKPPADDFMIRFYSGLAMAQLGQVDRAQELFHEASRYVPPDHPVRAELDKLLSA